VSVSGTHIQITGPVTAQASDTLTTLNISGANDFTLADGATLTVSGILKTGNNAAVVSGGVSIQAPTNSDLVIRTGQSSDALSINTPIVANGTNALTVSGAGILSLDAVDLYSGATAVNSGTLRLGNAHAVQNSTLTLNNSSNLAFGPGIGTFIVGDLAGSGYFVLTDGSAAAVTLQVGGNNATTNYSGSIGGNGTLIKVGDGILTMSGGSTYSGGTVLVGGLLAIGSDAVGAPAGTPAPLGALPPAGLGANNVILNGGTLEANATFTLNSLRGIGIGPSAGSVGGTGTIGVANGMTLTYNGVIASAGNTGSNQLVKSDAGTLVLNGASTYGGGTAIIGGTLIAGPDALGAVAGMPAPLGALPAAGLGVNNIILNGGALEASASYTLNALRGIGLGPTSGTTGAVGAIDVSSGNTLIFNGVIASAGNSGSNQLTKIDSGTLVLGGLNTYNGGTNVQKGALAAR
jgi:autotransporter-associated beta strand protein